MNLIEAKRMLKEAGYGLIKESRANDFAGRAVANGLVEEIKDRIAELGLKGTVSIAEIDPEAGICISVSINGWKPFPMWLSKEDGAAEFADANYDVLCMAETYKVGLPADEAVKKAGEIFAKIVSSENTDLYLKHQGVDKDFVQNLITDIENIPNFYDGYDVPINYTVKPITLNTNVKPEVALAIDIEGVEKPLIIGFAKYSFAGCGNYTVFRCKDINDTRISPIGHSCETLDDAYDCLLMCAAERIKKIANGEIR